jgi:beta-lactamase regulating signal transducer with metallopeptidase domain
MISATFFSFFATILMLVWVAGLWQGALFVGLAAVMIRFMPRASATVRHYGLVMLFVLSLGIPWLSLLHRSAAAPAAHSLQVSFWIAFLLAGWWLAATLYRTMSLVLAWQYLAKVRRTAVPVAFPLEASDMGVRRRPRVCTSALVDTPVIVGFFRPMLLLPDWLAPTLTSEQFRQIALHECEHLRRCDDWTNLWLQIGITLFPLNPALLWLNRRIGVQRELACDAAVVAATARPVDYAASLVSIASQRRLAGSLQFALAAWGRQSEISQRVHALLQQPRQWTGMQRAAAMGAGMVLMLLSVAGLSLAPQLVSVKTPFSITAKGLQNRALPEPIAEVSYSSPETAAVRFRPTSYTVTTLTHTQPIAHHVVSSARNRRAPLAMRRSNSLRSTEAVSARLARVSDGDAPERSVVAVQYETRMQTIPALFVPTYLAVPVSGGWIMIQL